MRFEYMRVEEGSAIIIDAENMEVTEIGVNGCPGHLYISVDPEQSNCITWYDILARIFCGHYERPGVPKISERVANAKKWYNFL